MQRVASCGASEYTAIDDATRIRALRVYEKHTQANAIDFADHVARTLPLPHRHGAHRPRPRVRGPSFHWHVEDQGIRHVYIKPASPNLNGKVERSHLTDKLESYRLYEYTDDVDLAQKLAAGEESSNVHRPHGGLGGLTPYEVPKEKMTSWRAGQAKSGRSQLQ